MNDYELVYYAQEHDDVAYNMLYKKYKPLIYSFVSKWTKFYKSAKIDIDDVYTEVLFIFNKAIYSFNDNDGYLFSTYLTRCIKFKLAEIYRKNKKIADNEVEAVENEDGSNIFDNIENKNYIPENQLYYNIILEKISNYKGLTRLEKEILEYKVSGYKISDIAIILNKNYKSIYKSIEKIRLKLGSVIND